jgi:alkylation response protein AidB-like acyl-CoA dehydrogenase
MVIGCPPLLNDAFTSDELRKEVVPDILDGKKFIALAISEAFVGSDVRGMRTVAEKQSDGSYIVTGQKKWITGGSKLAVCKQVIGPLTRFCQTLRTGS